MRIDCLILAAALSTTAIPLRVQPNTPTLARASVDWPTYGGDAGGLKYSPLADIDRDNVAKLTVAFTWSPGESPIAAGPGQKAARPGMFQVTPLAIRDTLFLSTPYNRVVALDATTGRQLWAFDPKALFAMQRQDTPNDTIATPYMVDLLHSSLGVSFRDGPEGTSRPSGRLPIVKPPYGTLTAIDLNTGDTKWQIPLGDTPDVRRHPALAGVALPEKLGVAGSAGALVTRGGLVFTTGGGRVLYAIDSRSGATLWEFDLGQIGYANPMTYRTRAGVQYVVIASGTGANAKLFGFALPAR